jgi:hypothetical protein
MKRQLRLNRTRARRIRLYFKTKGYQLLFLLMALIYFEQQSQAQPLAFGPAGLPRWAAEAAVAM